MDKQTAAEYVRIFMRIYYGAFMQKLLVVSVLLLSFMIVGCASEPTVERIDSSTVTDLSGNWNDSDIRIVATSLVDACLSAPSVRNHTAKLGDLPIVIVGRIANESDEHIDTSILAKQLEAALINSGAVSFVANANERTEIRAEREDQQYNSSVETAALLANETGADYMLIGAIKTVVDSNGKDMTRTYFVNAELIDIETNRKLWIGENSEIKKYIKRGSVKL